MTIMRDDIKKRIEAVRRGEVPEGYSVESAMLYPNDWGAPTPLNRVLRENKERNEKLVYGKEDVLSVSGEEGIVNQIQLMGRSYAGESVAPYHVVETGDVVYTKSPLKGNPYGIIKQNHGKPGIVSTLYAVYHCSNPITGQYLENYFTIDTYLNNYLKPLVKRGAKNDMKVNNEEVLLGRIPLPPIREQRSINEVIDRINTLILQKQKLMEELQQLKKICLAKMFPQSDDIVPEIRFPGFSERWEQRMLSAIYKTIRNAFVGTATPYYVPNGHFYLESNNVKDGQINTNTKVFINDEFYYQQKSKWLHTNDIVMVQSGHVGHAAVIPESFDNTAAHALIVFTHPICEIEPYFLNYQFQTAKSLKKISDIATGNTIKHILASDMQNFVVDIPSIGEQRQIAAIFQKLDSLITLHQRELEEVQRKKKALMQLLLTGLVRVNV